MRLHPVLNSIAFASERGNKMTLGIQLVLALGLLAGCGGGSIAAPVAGISAPALPAPPAPTLEAGTPLQLTAADGVKIFGMRYDAPKPRAVILLFHQGNSNFGEYRNIAPRLVQEGYSALAIDERHGDNEFGKVNETAKLYGKFAGNLEALPDLEAAVAWAQTLQLPVVVWGSSDSASLVFGLAAKYPTTVKAVLSFSPDMTDAETPDWTRQAAAKTLQPVFITSASTAAEISRAGLLAQQVASLRKTVYVPKTYGIHGSSMLDSTRSTKGVEENWSAVLDFLKTAL